MSDASLQAQHGCVNAGLAGRPNFGEPCRQWLRLIRLQDAQRRTRLLEMQAMQIMLAVDNQERVGRDLALGTGLQNRHGMAVNAQQLQHSGASAFEVARVVYDDVEPATAYAAQKSSETLDALRAIPTRLRQILIKHLNVVLRECDELVDGGRLLGNRCQLCNVWLGRISRGGGIHRGTIDETVLRRRRESSQRSSRRSSGVRSRDA